MNIQASLIGATSLGIVGKYDYDLKVKSGKKGWIKGSMYPTSVPCTSDTSETEY